MDESFSLHLISEFLILEQEVEGRREGSRSRVWQVRFALLHSRAPQRQHCIIIHSVVFSSQNWSLLVAGTEVLLEVGVGGPSLQ